MHARSARAVALASDVMTNTFGRANSGLPGAHNCGLPIHHHVIVNQRRSSIICTASTSVSNGSSDNSSNPNNPNSPRDGVYESSNRGAHRNAMATAAHNTLKFQWQVPRNSIHHYPEETRQRLMHDLNTKYQKPETDPLVSKCRQALEYERHMGYVDFIGRNGDSFSRWMGQQLSSPEFSSSGASQGTERGAIGKRYAQDWSLIRAMEELYGGMNVTERARVVAAVGAWLDGWQQAAEGRAAHGDEASSASGSEPLGDKDKDKERKPRSPVKQSTIDFRTNFMETAMQGSSKKNPVNELEGDQRTQLWKSLRESRLTASAFSKALGFFPGDRISLWEEKIGIREPFKGNDATRWGTKSEARALMTYERLTGQQVESCMFKVKKDDVVHDWLGASPDGLVAGLGLQADGRGSHGAEKMYGTPGILEIKCPFNKGAPELAEPPQRAIWYYMPQIQGLMDVFDREWCALYVWTPAHGSSSFIIPRDRAYWAACFDVLAEFWWSHTVPARQLRGVDVDDVLIEEYRPSEEHEKSHMLVEWSKRIAWTSKGTVYPHVNLDS